MPTNTYRAIRPLAVASARRAERLPQLQTIAEAGVIGVEADAWFALFAPAKTPKPVIEQLYGAVTAALDRRSSALIPVRPLVQ